MNVNKLSQEYAYIPMLPNGAPDLSCLDIINTPLGSCYRIKTDPLPFLNIFIQRNKEAGLMDEQGNWVKEVPKGAIALWIKMYAETLQITPEWKRFEELWHLSTLKTQVMKESHPKYDYWHKKFTLIFRSDISG